MSVLKLRFMPKTYERRPCIAARWYEHPKDRLPVVRMFFYLGDDYKEEITALLDAVAWELEK